MSRRKQQQLNPITALLIALWMIALATRYLWEML